MVLHNPIALKSGKRRKFTDPLEKKLLRASESAFLGFPYVRV
jgi:hypothetical protein